MMAKHLTFGLTMLALVFAPVHVAAQSASVRPVHDSLAREHWQDKGRFLPGRAALRRRAIQQKIAARAGRVRPSSSLGIGFGWASLGPLPLPSDASGTGIQDYGWVSGRTAAVVIDPNDPSANTVFVGAAYGGVWKSTNAGSLSANPSLVTWTALTDDQPTLAVGAIAVQPQASSPDPARSVVLAGTGETNSSADSYYGLGILRSTDGGAHWTLIPQDVTGTYSFAGLGFSRIAFSRANPNLVVAAAGSASQGVVEGLESPVGVNRGLYYSSDAGATWHAATITDPGGPVTGASASSVEFNAATGKFYAALRFHGFYVSSDGANWNRLPAQPGPGLTSVACPAQIAQPVACPIYRGEIAVVPSRAGSSGMGEMYVWYVDSNDADRGIWASVDGGISWYSINDSGITNCGDFFGGCGTAQGSYNLALAAVPNGSATDLYAGATNLYKCTIVLGNSTCSGTGPNTFRNLTHVYGCSDIAKVHPDQHAMDFAVTNGTAPMYFANDGGIYRAVDGFTGLTTGTCGLSNQFENLNETLGPLAQFVSMSGSASNVNLLWGSSPGNGAPATGFAQSGNPWVNVSAGDVGFTATSPMDDTEWFISTPPDSLSGVNVLRCWNGVNCRTQDFQNDPIVTGTAVAGDVGPFSLPFILDRLNPGTMLVGTCRVWRGSSSGGSFSLLSPNFEVGGAGACSGSETNMVRAIAASGPADTTGNSQVIYVGTNGEGPSVATTPSGGHVWVTMNASAGPNAWADRSGWINPQGFPVSSIVIDPSDPSGQTAYAAIMGFHTSHVWRTSSAGLWWFDFTANLPDAPANALIIDPINSTIYVGTDVGVFASSTAWPDWTEVGPPSGQSGFLPNVAVTSLQLFNAGGSKRLRAATYGRGIWEWNLVTTPDFLVSVSNPQQTVLAGQTATFSGNLYAQNGYVSGVTLTCAAASTSPPLNCSTNPASAIPIPQGTAFTVNGSDAVGDYSFDLLASGTDASSVTHTFPLVLHVVDFTLGAPSPGAITLAPGSSSSPVSLTVSAAGAFTGTVDLSCGGAPTGVGCQFQPASVSPTPGNPASVSLLITASSVAPLGTAQIALNASTQGATNKTQTLSITIAPVPDFTMEVTDATLSAQVNTQAVFNGTITGVNGYSSAVALACATGAPPTCIVSPTNIVPGAAGTPFTVTVSSTTAQIYSFNLNADGTDTGKISHSAALTFTALPSQTFDFSISASPSSVAVARGKAGLYSLAVNPTTGSFPTEVNFSCSGLPALASCAFNPTQVSAGSGSSAVTVSISTTAPSSNMASLPMAFPLVAILLVPATRRRWRRLHWLVLFTCLVLMISSCGGGLQGNGNGNGGGSGNPGTKPGNYIVTITATCGTLTHSTAVTLTVTP